MHIRNRHTQKTQPPHAGKKKKREHVFIRRFISNKTPQTINERVNLWGYRIGTVSGKTILHWGFKPGSRVHQRHTFFNRFSYEQTSASCLGEKKTPNPHQHDNVACIITQTYKT
jgi:hypothetical protein